MSFAVSHFEVLASTKERGGLGSWVGGDGIGEAAVRHCIVQGGITIYIYTKLTKRSIAEKMLYSS